MMDCTSPASTAEPHTSKASRLSGAVALLKVANRGPRIALRADAPSLCISNTIAREKLTFSCSWDPECTHSPHNAECVMLHECLHGSWCLVVAQHDPSKVDSLASRLEYLLVGGLQAWDRRAHACCCWCTARLEGERVEGLGSLGVRHVVGRCSSEQTAAAATPVAAV